MTSQLRVRLTSLTGAFLLAGLLPGCGGPDNPKIVEVPNLKELESKTERETGPQKGMPHNYGQGKAYQKAYEKRLERMQGK